MLTASVRCRYRRVFISMFLIDFVVDFPNRIALCFADVDVVVVPGPFQPFDVVKVQIFEKLRWMQVRFEDPFC